MTYIHHHPWHAPHVVIALLSIISTNNIARGMVRGSQVRFQSTKNTLSFGNIFSTNNIARGMVCGSQVRFQSTKNTLSSRNIKLPTILISK
jgi:hypothetical protein